MRKLGVILTATAMSVGATGCSKVPEAKQEAASATPAVMPGKPSLTVLAKMLDEKRVEFTIGTNLPMPIEVIVSVDLHGQKDSDSYIGYSENVKLTGEKTVFVVDTTKATRPLPKGSYDATVRFVPRWGAAGNPFDGKIPELFAETHLDLTGSGGSVSDEQRSRQRQGWVMENVVSGMRWDKSAVEGRLGKSIRGASELGQHETYYFPGADMSLLVNRLTSEVTTWRKGNAIVPPNASRAVFVAKGLNWPLTVDAGYLGCTGSAIYFTTLDGVSYGVNGAAAQYKNIKPIWASDKKMMGELRAAGVKGGPELKVNIGDMIAEGQKLCS